MELTNWIAKAQGLGPLWLAATKSNMRLHEAVVICPKKQQPTKYSAALFGMVPWLSEPDLSAESNVTCELLGRRHLEAVRRLLTLSFLPSRLPQAAAGMDYFRRP